MKISLSWDEKNSRSSDVIAAQIVPIAPGTTMTAFNILNRRTSTTVAAKYYSSAETALIQRIDVTVIIGCLLPIFWQTWWFRLLAGLACLFGLLAFHQLRLRQLTRQLNARFDERFEERARIAQDLHDTLLQGFISASMQLYVAVEQLPADSPAKSRLDQVQQLIGRIVEEGRITVQGLHNITGDLLDLEQAFSHIPQEFDFQNERISFLVTVKGKPRALRPLIRDEIYRVCREAIFHAFRSPGTKSIEVELKFSVRKLRIFVRDDGGLMSARTKREESAALERLRERAGKIGARLKIRSRADVGTKVELWIPGQVAFLNQFSIRGLGWFARSSPPRTFTRFLKVRSQKDER